MCKAKNITYCRNTISMDLLCARLLLLHCIQYLEVLFSRNSVFIPKTNHGTAILKTGVIKSISHFGNGAKIQVRLYYISSAAVIQFQFKNCKLLMAVTQNMTYIVSSITFWANTQFFFFIVFAFVFQRR